MPYVRVRGYWIRVRKVPLSFLHLDLDVFENRVTVTDYAHKDPMEKLNCSTLAKRVRVPDGEIEIYKTGTILRDNGKPLIFLTHNQPYE